MQPIQLAVLLPVSLLAAAAVLAARLVRGIGIALYGVEGGFETGVGGGGGSRRSLTERGSLARHAISSVSDCWDDGIISEIFQPSTVIVTHRSLFSPEKGVRPAAVQVTLGGKTPTCSAPQNPGARVCGDTTVERECNGMTTPPPIYCWEVTATVYRPLCAVVPLCP